MTFLALPGLLDSEGRDSALSKWEIAMHKNADDDYAKGQNDNVSEVPEPMRILMQENSRALDSITKTAGGSHSRKPSED